MHRRTAKRPAHRMPRVVKRERNPRAGEFKKLTLCLWSAGGELVRRVDAFGSTQKAPSFSMWGGVRYDRIAQPVASGVVHYRASVIERKAAG